MNDEAHTPTVQRKVAPGYRDEDGRDHPAHLLRRYECSCGWKGACWYAGEDRARAHFARHIERTKAES